MTAFGYTGGDPTKLDKGGYPKGTVVAANTAGDLTPVPVDANGLILTLDSSEPTGVDWEAGGGGGGTPSNTVVTEQAFGQASTAGVAAAFSRGDHTHGTPAAPSVPSPAGAVVTEQSFGQASAVGVGTAYARNDHTHGTPNAPAVPGPATTVVTEQTFGQASAVGAAGTYAREDHTHGTPAAPAAPPTPSGSVVAETNYGQSTVVGVAATYSRGDHSHGSPALGTTGTTAAAGNDSRIVNAIQTTLIDAKGDLLAGTANDTITRHPVGTNGQFLRANSAQADGLDWITLYPLARRPVSGRFVICPDVGAVTASLTLNADELLYVPFPVAETYTVDQMVVEANGATAGSNIRLGIYAATGLLPGALVVDLGQVAASPNGNKVFAVTPSQALTPGLWFLACVGQTVASAVVRGANSHHPLIYPSTSPTGTGLVAAYTQAGVSGALPATATIGGVGQAPRIGVRAV